MKFLSIAIAALTLFAALPKAEAQTFRVCHGYECYYQTKLTLSAQDLRRIQNLMQQGAQSAAAERKALRAAIALFEQRSTAIIGIRDKPRMQFGKARIKGQMDCIDESTNTDNFIRYLNSRGWLKHHTPVRKTARGSFSMVAIPIGLRLSKPRMVSAGQLIPGTKQAAARPTSCHWLSGSAAAMAAKDKYGLSASETF